MQFLSKIKTIINTNNKFINLYKFKQFQFKSPHNQFQFYFNNFNQQMSQQEQEIIEKKIKISENQSKSIPETIQENIKSTEQTQQKNLKENQNKSEDIDEDDKVSQTSHNSDNEEKYIQKAPQRLYLKGFQNYDLERHVLKFVNKFHPDPEQGFKINKIYKPKSKYFAIIEFESVEEKQSFESNFKLPAHSSKKKRIKIQEQTPKQLNQIRLGRKMERIEKQIDNKQKVIVATPEQLQKVRDTPLAHQIVPYLQKDYQEQVELKKQSFKEVLEKWQKSALKQYQGEINSLSPPWLIQTPEITEFIECPEPERLYYRNKMEFSIGKDFEGKNVIGMVKGSQADGTAMVESAETITVLTKEGIKLAKIFTDYITIRQNQNEICQPMNKIDKKGYYKVLEVRQSQRTKQVMLNLVIYHPEVNFPQDLLEEEKKSIINFVQEQPNEELKEFLDQSQYTIQSLNLVLTSNPGDGGKDTDQQINVIGPGYYQDTILGKKFNVSNGAFLQNHSGMCDRLYTLIQNLIQSDINEETVFLDVCSGIGTIGICMAEKCKQVIGIEMVESACEAAKENVKLNNIENYQVICSKVEHVMFEIIEKHKKENPNVKIVAVVDPPRNGLHKAVVKALRNCPLLDNLVYVACSPSNVIDNLNFLCLPQGGGGRANTPFAPNKQYAVDLFPNTSHYEGVFYLTRQTQLKQKQ